jgi:hypothetical protein
MGMNGIFSRERFRRFRLAGSSEEIRLMKVMMWT